jgi:hypothetical protein
LGAQGIGSLIAATGARKEVAKRGPVLKLSLLRRNMPRRKRVYLRRPTFLNKGFDFQVNVEGFRSKTRKAKGVTKEMPSHPDVYRDLRGKVRAYPKLKKELYAAVCAVYDCNEIDKILSRRRKLLKIEKGLPVDKILRIIKWLFIEQDLTYWLGTGRNMLMSAIEKKVFKIQAELYE